LFIGLIAFSIITRQPSSTQAKTKTDVGMIDISPYMQSFRPERSQPAEVAVPMTTRRPL